MRILANENIARLTVEALRVAGHDLLWAYSDLSGSGDETILSRAQTEGRVLLTNDKDFGDLAFHAGLPATCGIILFRLGKLSPQAGANRVARVIDSRTDWTGHMAVIDEFRVRMRPLPPSR